MSTATATSGWKCSHSTAIVAETELEVTIRVTCYWETLGWTYDIGWVNAYVYCDGVSKQVMTNGHVTAMSSYTKYSLGSYDFKVTKSRSSRNVSCHAYIDNNSSYATGEKSSTNTNVAIAALPTYTISYNANGGTGVPSSQTKWHGTPITLATSTPTKNGHTFVHWNTKSNGTGTGYAPGAGYNGNANITFYAIWKANTYTVKYDANGGTGAPANQTKTYGVNLTITTDTPTRQDYNFLGWSTVRDGPVAIMPGGSYANNSAITFYAVWELAYVKPRINNFNAYRCTEDGTASETGTYIKASFDWETDYDLVSMYIDWTIGTDWPNRVSEKVITSGTSGSVSQIVGGGNIDSDITYSTRAWAKDSGGSQYSYMITIGTAKFPIDVKAGGTGVAIGKAAEKDAFEVGMDQYIYGDIHVERSEPDSNARCFARRVDTGTEVWLGVGAGGTNHGVYSTNLNKWLIYSDGEYTYIGNDTGTYKVGTACGRNVASASVVSHSNLNSNNTRLPDMTFLSYWNGAYNSSNASNLKYCKEGSIQSKPTVLYNNASGAKGTITLSESAANFSYLEIFYKLGSRSLSEKSTTVHDPNGKTANLTFSYYYNTTYGVYVFTKDAVISGTTITGANAGWEYIGNDRYIGAYDDISILKVIGYK